MQKYLEIFEKYLQIFTKTSTIKDFSSWIWFLPGFVRLNLFFSEHLFEQHCLLSTFNIRIPIGKWANAVVFLYDAVLLHQGVLTPRAWLDLILPAQCPVISDHLTNQKSSRSYLKPNWIYQTIKTNLMSELVFLEKFGPLMHFVAFTFTLRGFVNT